ncbi:MAG: DUF6544 family protein, partial [Geminicoccales bacterium]
MIWLFCALALVAAGLLAARAREQARTSRLLEALGETRRGHNDARVSVASFSALPDPVARYLASALRDGQPPIEQAELQQRGELRAQPEASRWSAFSARHLARPMAVSFLWNASVLAPLGARVRVIDSYVGGTGSGRVSLYSTIRLGMESGTPELDAGALLRYLAESVWFPTALLPESGVAWTAIDAATALATLTDGAATVSLEFRFNHAGEVAAIYSPGRWARTRSGYESLPWEGHFGDYREHSGMRI